MSISQTITIKSDNPPPVIAATSISLGGLVGGTTFEAVGPIAAGTTICPVLVGPGGWVGTLVLTGSNAVSYVASGTGPNWTVKVVTAIPAGQTDSIIVTATP